MELSVGSIINFAINVYINNGKNIIDTFLLLLIPQRFLTKH